MITLIIFLLVLSLLVVVHEWGHFIIAKKSGMKVYEFGLGFPPRAFGVYKDSTTNKWIFVWGKGKSSVKDAFAQSTGDISYPSTLYSINWLPLGGFVKIKGENGENSKDSDSFGYHPFYKKAGVLVAGVTMNIMLAAVLLSIGFTIGIPSDITGVKQFTDGAYISEGPWVTVQQVQPDSSAAENQLTFSDRLVGLNNQPIVDSAAFIDFVKNTPDKFISLDIEHEGKITQKIFALDGNPGDSARLGAAISDVAIIKYPWYMAIIKGIMAAISGLIAIYVAFFVLIKQLILGNGLAFEVSGPVGIASIVGQSAKMGIQYLVQVTAMISLSLAAINILPIPALDGGRLVFVLIEKITKKPVPLKYEQIAHTVGFLALMTLIIIVTWRDIANLI